MSADLIDRGYPDLGPADGPLKRAILGENAARLYGVDPAAYRQPAHAASQLDAVAAAWRAASVRQQRRCLPGTARGWC